MKRFIAIAGNVGVGKSTLTALLSEKLGWEPSEIPLPVLIPLGRFGEYLSGLSPQERAGDKSELFLSYLDKLFAGLHLPQDFCQHLSGPSHIEGVVRLAARCCVVFVCLLIEAHSPVRFAFCRASRTHLVGDVVIQRRRQ